MPSIAIISGTGLNQIDDINIIKMHKSLNTPYGPPSADIIEGQWFNKSVLFLARHGTPHLIPPHQVNYRANIAALKQCGAEKIIAINAVGGIHPDMAPQQLVLPEQLIDYTYGRKNSLFDSAEDPILHIDFSKPYDTKLRQLLIDVGHANNIPLINFGVHAITQGPRLETSAEIKRLKNDGCDVVGMTGMPEAALAREMGLAYISLCLVANWAAGISKIEISLEEMHTNMDICTEQLFKLLGLAIPEL